MYSTRLSVGEFHCTPSPPLPLPKEERFKTPPPPPFPPQWQVPRGHAGNIPLPKSSRKNASVGSLHKFMQVPLHLLASRYRHLSTLTVLRHTSCLAGIEPTAYKRTRQSRPFFPEHCTIMAFAFFTRFSDSFRINGIRARGHFAVATPSVAAVRDSTRKSTSELMPHERARSYQYSAATLRSGLGRSQVLDAELYVTDRLHRIGSET